MAYRQFDLSRARDALTWPGFRWYLLGRIAGTPTDSMRSVAQGWLMYELTGSTLALSWIPVARAAVMFALAPAGGIIADRVDKRVVMALSRALLIVANAALAGLVFLGMVQPWHVVAAAMLEGVAFSLLDPALRAVLPELVGGPVLLSAVSLSLVIEGTAGIFGGALAGLTINAVGVPGVFATMGLLFLIAAYTHLRQPRSHSTAGQRLSLRGDLAETLAYVRGNPFLLLLLGLSFVETALLQPVRALLPAFASATLGLDAAGLGFLTSCIGIGGLLASLMAAGKGHIRRQGRLLMLALIGEAVSLVILMLVPVLPLPFIMVTAQFGFAMLANVMTSTLLLVVCEPRFRGRVSAALVMAWGVASLTPLPAGALADVYGVAPVLAAMGLIGLGLCLAVAAARRDLIRQH